MPPTHAFNLLTTGGTVLLEPSPDADFSPRMRGRLDRVQPKRGLILALARISAGWSPPGDGDPVNVLVPVGARLWRFPTRVLSIEHGEAAFRFLLAWPEAARQHAGRNAPRVAAILPVRAPLIAGAGGGRWIASYSLDVGGTGLQFLHPRDLTGDSGLPMQLRVPEGTVEFTAQVAWVRPFRDDAGDPLFRIGAAFAEITSGGQQRVLRFVREAQIQEGPLPSG